MYRTYQNPYTIQARLDELRDDYQTAVEEGADEDVLIDLMIDIAEAEDQLRFAWDDDEYDTDYRD